MPKSDSTVSIDRSKEDGKVSDLKRTPGNDAQKNEAAASKSIPQKDKINKQVAKEAESARKQIVKESKDSLSNKVDMKSDKDRSSSKDDGTCNLEKKLSAPSNVAVPRKSQPYVPPISNERPLVLATHLVPSLPISLFELLVEMIEIATERPVTLLYEPRSDRRVAKDITDIAILPANEEWEDGKLLPVSFIFKHRLNKENSPHIYADVIVASDLASHVENIADIRGYRCALPDRSRTISATTLLYNYLHSLGEGPAFFGNTLDVDTQMAALQMVAGKQAEVSILESPVIMCQKNTLPGVESLRVITSLGPLPPYRIMANKTLSDALVKKLTSYLLDCNKNIETMRKLKSFGILGFAGNSMDSYELSDAKPVITRAPYY